MSDELLIFEFLESDNIQEKKNEAKLQRRRLRDHSDPFDINESLFIKRYRLSKQLVHNLCDELRLHVAATLKSSDLSLERKVLIALSFYATGSYQRPVGDISAHSVAQSTVSVVLKQITELLNMPHMRAKYIKFPKTTEERNANKTQFINKFQMPGVLGCIDCTRVAIVRPGENETRYYCTKKYHSLNVQLICNADMQILSVDASFGGATNDSVIWANHPLKEHMEIISRNEEIWLLGDSGYPLRKYMMTPVTDAAPDTPEAHFNSVHVRTWNVVERTIGVLKARFQCLLVNKVLHYSPTFAASIVNACVILHNICNHANVPVSLLTDEELMLEASRQIDTTHLKNQPSSFTSHSDLEMSEGLAVRQTLISSLWSSRS